MSKRRDVVIARLIQVVQKLGALSEEFVFIGGSVVPLLVTDEAAPDARPTKDVDAIVQVLTHGEYHKIVERLASVGFHLDPMEEVICRYKSADLVLDVMPTYSEILKFGNKWYVNAADAPLTYELLKERVIKVINAPLFVCTKICAYKDRGQEDEKDLEDIISIVDGRREFLEELAESPPEIKSFVSEGIKQLIDGGLDTRIDWFLPGDAAGAAREAIVLERLKKIVRIENS